MPTDAAADLDPRARAELDAERDRHIGVMQSLSAGESDALATESFRHLRTVEEIKRACAGRMKLLPSLNA